MGSEPAADESAGVAGTAEALAKKAPVVMELKWDPSEDSLDEKLATILIQPNPDEKDDANMPKNLHNAGELFLSSGKGSAAKLMQQCAQSFFSLVANRPKGDDVTIGQAYVCWECGYCGLHPTHGSAGEVSDPRGCSVCGHSQINNVNAVLADGSSIPWMTVLVQDTAAEAVADAKDASPDEDDGPIEGLDDRLLSFRIIPNGEEDSHPNFPKNLHNAMELFMRVGHTKSARRLQRCTSRFFELLEAGPKPGDVSGKAHVCFECGHCGMAPAAMQSKERAAGEQAGACGNCGADSHSNFVELVLPNGRQLPWMERGPAAAAPKKIVAPKPAGRVKPNEPCHCGSGKKAKKCCHVGGA